VAAGENGSDRPSRGPLEQALLAALGWAALTAEGADALADELARRVGLDRDALRDALEDAVAAWKRDGERLASRRGDVVDGLAARFGVAQEARVEDLELRLAQLEHRLKLLERG
jgi:polyhydroxyalkanoate synthesis regulator phasin